MATRDQALKKLRELAETMLIGSTSETFRTCGNPGCRCHSTGPKHGPHLYVSYRGEHGKTSGYYVPKALQQAVRNGLEAWAEFHELAKQVAQQNEELLRSSARKPSPNSKPMRRTRRS